MEDLGQMDVMRKQRIGLCTILIASLAAVGCQSGPLAPLSDMIMSGLWTYGPPTPIACPVRGSVCYAGLNQATGGEPDSSEQVTARYLSPAPVQKPSRSTVFQTSRRCPCHGGCRVVFTLAPLRCQWENTILHGINSDRSWIAPSKLTIPTMPHRPSTAVSSRTDAPSRAPITQRLSPDRQFPKLARTFWARTSSNNWT